MSEFASIGSCTDTFGRECTVGDTVHFKSYDHISEGVITEIRHNNKAALPKNEWMIHIHRTYIQTFGSRVEPEKAVVRSLSHLAKVCYEN